MSLESFTNEAIDINLWKPGAAILKAGKNFVIGESKNGTFVNDMLSVVGGNINLIGKTTFGAISSLIGGTVSLGLKSAMLIPLPVPGGSIAGTFAPIRRLNRAIDIKATTGDSRSLAEITAKIEENDRTKKSSVEGTAA